MWPWHIEVSPIDSVSAPAGARHRLESLNSYYFDSYGFVPPLEVEQKIRPYTYDDADMQDFNSEACGYYALAFIKFLNDNTIKEVVFKEFLRLLKATHTKMIIYFKNIWN
jgi:hypothetical protein